MRKRARLSQPLSHPNEQGIFYSPPAARQSLVMDKHDGFMKALKCRECGREYPLKDTHVCEFDFGPLEVAYDYTRIAKSLTKKNIESRDHTMWRFRELLPVAQDPTVGAQVGYTP